MIEKNEREQYLRCTLCGEVTELRRQTLSNWETVQLMVEELRREHKACDEFADDPERARIERAYRVNMRKETRRRPCRTYGSS